MTIINSAHFTRKAAMGTVVTQHIADGFYVGQFINGDYLKLITVAIFIQGTQHTAPYSAKSINRNAQRHKQTLVFFERCVLWSKGEEMLNIKKGVPERMFMVRLTYKRLLTKLEQT